jgi:hypothetical protein
MNEEERVKDPCRVFVVFLCSYSSPFPVSILHIKGVGFSVHRTDPSPSILLPVPSSNISYLYLPVPDSYPPLLHAPSPQALHLLLARPWPARLMPPDLP